MATTTASSPFLSVAPSRSPSSILASLSALPPVSDTALHAAVRPLRAGHLRAVVDAARSVAHNSSLPGAVTLARRVLAAVEAMHGPQALR